MAFDQAAVNTLMDNAVSTAMALGVFENVNMHEPKSALDSGTWCAIWVQEISPITGGGLAATSGKVVLTARVYGNVFTTTQDQIDPAMMTATTALLGAYSGEFTMGETARNIDLLGTYGTAMGAVAGYVNLSGTVYRIMDITVPVIINDMWSQEA